MKTYEVKQFKIKVFHYEHIALRKLITTYF